jgi:hypothetical protein
MKNKFLGLAAVLLICFGCDKDDDDPSDPTRTEIITQSTWKFDNAGIDQDKDGDVDLTITSQIPACVADNSFTLATNGTGVLDEGAAKCNASDAQTSPITWSFASNETILNMSSGFAGIGGQSRILALNNTTLSLTKDTSIAFFGNVAVIVNLKH